MSFILDALKKSENERQEHRSAEFASVPSGKASEGPPRWLWILVALLAVNVVVLLGLLLRDDTQAVIAEATEPPPVAATPAACASSRRLLTGSMKRVSANR